MDYIFDLNTLETTGIIECPYCGRSKAYVYNNATGKLSSACNICGRIVPFNTDDKYNFYIENYGNEVVDLEIFVEIFKKIGDNLSCIARYYEEMAPFVPDYD